MKSTSYERIVKKIKWFVIFLKNLSDDSIESLKYLLNFQIFLQFLLLYTESFSFFALRK